MSDYTEFFLSDSRNVAKLELFEISHPNFEKLYRICRNRYSGATVTLHDSTTATFGYYPVSIKRMGVSDDMEQRFQVTVGDVGDLLNNELERVHELDGFETKPSFTYWAYKSNNLLVPLEGPIRLKIGDVTQNDEGFTFEASAEGFNVSKTGELYRLDRFPMLRGVL